MSQDFTIPDYSIRESRRATHVTIKVSSWTGLEVVVPIGFKRSEILKILQSKAHWIERSLARTHPVEELARSVRAVLPVSGPVALAEVSVRQESERERTEPSLQPVGCPVHRARVA